MCNCRYCRVTNLAHAALDAGEKPADPVVMEAVMEILLFRAENEAAGAEQALNFARDDDRFGFDDRAAMFRGIAFKRREHAAELRAAASRWPKV